LIAIDEALHAKQEQKQADARKQSKVRLKPFRETVQDYVAEHLAAALQVLTSVQRKNSEDSLERSAAINKQTEMFEEAADVIRQLTTEGMDDTGEILPSYREKCCSFFRKIYKSVTAGLDVFFRDPTISRADAADASSRLHKLLRRCILAFAEPDQDPDNAGRYDYWQTGHHATRFTRVLCRFEADFVQIFPGFEPTVVPDIAPSGESIPDQFSPPADSGNDLNALRAQISALKARFREPEMERYNLIGPIAALKKHLPNQLTVERGVDYLKQKIEALTAAANGVRKGLPGRDGLLKARAARRAGG
jgi:predicted RNase H-like nuclease (RuvC/YqgF family)